MNWEAIGAIGEVLGSVAVVVTLVCLGVQLFLWRDGAIPAELWGASLRTLESVPTQPGARRWWPVAKDRFSQDFQLLVEERCSQPPAGTSAERSNEQGTAA